jgi:phage repressor protein C with HTH and peptisase S24 domain
LGTFYAGDSLVYIPLMAPRLAAGSGEVVLSEEAEKVYGFRREWVSRIGSARAMRLFRVRGDSMRPTVLDKDMVLVDLDRSALEEDQLFAVGWFGELAVKRLRRAETGAVEVVSDNPTHPTRTVRDEGDGFRIVGRVVWLAREV